MRISHSPTVRSGTWLSGVPGARDGPITACPAASCTPPAATRASRPCAMRVNDKPVAAMLRALAGRPLEGGVAQETGRCLQCVRAAKLAVRRQQLVEARIADHGGVA